MNSQLFIFHMATPKKPNNHRSHSDPTAVTSSLSGWWLRSRRNLIPSGEIMCNMTSCGVSLSAGRGERKKDPGETSPAVLLPPRQPLPTLTVTLQLPFMALRWSCRALHEPPYTDIRAVKYLKSDRWCNHRVWSDEYQPDPDVKMLKLGIQR